MLVRSGVEPRSARARVNIDNLIDLGNVGLVGLPGVIGQAKDVHIVLLDLSQLLLGARAGAVDGVLGLGEVANGLAPVILVPNPHEHLVVRIDLVQLVRAREDRRVVREGVSVFLRPDVLGDDQLATDDLAPEHQVLAGAGLGHLDDDGVVIGGVDIVPELRCSDGNAAQVLVVGVLGHIQRVDHVVGREGLAVVPRHTLAQVQAQLGVIVVVLPALAQPRDDLAGGVVGVPHELNHELLDTVLIVPAVGDEGVEAIEDREVDLVADDGLGAAEVHRHAIDLELHELGLRFLGLFLDRGRGRRRLGCCRWLILLDLFDRGENDGGRVGGNHLGGFATAADRHHCDQDCDCKVHDLSQHGFYPPATLVRFLLQVPPG